MARSLKGDLSSLRALKARLRGAPVTVARDVARRAAPEMTALARGAFTAGRTVYGDPRPSSVTGKPLQLVRTGATLRTMLFASLGTLLRCELGTRWARYLIGKYSVLPNGPLPAAWSRKLEEVVTSTKAPL